MDDELLHFLRAFLTELVGRYSHLEQFVDVTRQETRDTTPKLLIRYGELLQQKTRKLLGYADILSDLPKGVMNARELEGPFGCLLQESREFQSFHKALKWFPTPWPGSAIFQFLTQLSHERAIVDFDTLHPTVVLSDEYNFLAYDLNQDLPSLSASRSSLAVWALPKSESTNPLLWPVLAHEIAHSFYGPRELASTITPLLSPYDDISENLQSLAIELNADLLAFRLLGPAYLYSLMYFSMFFITTNLRMSIRSEGAYVSHPAPDTRIQLLWKEVDSLKAKLKTNNLQHVEYSPQLQQVWLTLDKFKNLYDARLSFDTATQPMYSEDYDGLPEEVVNHVWNDIKTFQHRERPDVDITMIELETSVGLADRLAKRELAGSVAPTSKSISNVRHFVAKSIAHSASDELYKRSPTGYELRLLSVAATNNIVDEGRNLVIVALIGERLHIRIFDASGEKVIDKADNNLVSGDKLTALKKRLSPFRDDSSLSSQDKQEILQTARSIAGHACPTRDDVLDELDERPASMAEILNGGWEYKISTLYRSLLFEGKPEQLQNGQSFESYCKANVLEQSRQLRKSIETAIIMASISRFGRT